MSNSSSRAAPGNHSVSTSSDDASDSFSRLAPRSTDARNPPTTMADNKEALRALKIKTGVLTRVKKELAMYQKEVKSESEKLEAMRAEGRDAHDIKQQVRRACVTVLLERC